MRTEIRSRSRKWYYKFEINDFHLLEDITNSPFIIIMNFLTGRLLLFGQRKHVYGIDEALSMQQLQLYDAKLLSIPIRTPCMKSTYVSSGNVDKPRDNAKLPDATGTSSHKKDYATFRSFLQ